MSKHTLPDKLSALIRVAVEDCKKAEKDPKYTVDMNLWHCLLNVGEDKSCHVCMAGAVMAMSLHSDPTHNIAPSDFREGDIGDKLDALDSVRLGNLVEACEVMCIDLTEETKAQIHDISEMIDQFYSPRTRRADWDTYLEAANELEAIGL